jgi:hypothetical protein
MKVRFRKYNPAQDFLRVRDMLVQTFRQFEKPINWTLERWNYARYFGAPYLGGYGSAENSTEKSLEAIHNWEAAIGIWEDDASHIVAVVCPDEHVPWHRSYGLAYFQRRPDQEYLLDSMFDFAENHYQNKGTVRVFITDYDESLKEFAEQRGYEQGEKSWGHWMEYVLDNLPEPDVPDGFHIQSMADENILEKRTKVFGLAFGHKEPKEWPTVFSYQELQKAPDYRKDLDLYVVGPSGDYVACCIVWIDRYNKIARLEPVGSLVLGMGREVVMEGLRRAVALGARKAYMESNLRFYRAIGFKPLFEYGRVWHKSVERSE